MNQMENMKLFILLIYYNDWFIISLMKNYLNKNLNNYFKEKEMVL